MRFPAYEISINQWHRLHRKSQWKDIDIQMKEKWNCLTFYLAGVDVANDDDDLMIMRVIHWSCLSSFSCGGWCSFFDVFLSLLSLGLQFISFMTLMSDAIPVLMTKKASLKPELVFLAHSVLWWLESLSWVSFVDFGTRSWSVSQSDTGYEPFQFFSFVWGNDWYGTLSPTQGFGIECKSVVLFFSIHVHLPNLSLPRCLCRRQWVTRNTKSVKDSKELQGKTWKRLKGIPGD